MMKQPPEKFLVDSFQYKEPTGRNKWDEPTYGEAIEIVTCRIDREAVYTSKVAGRELLYNAVIFCYAGRTYPMLEFKTEGIVIFDGVERQINKVIPIKQPYIDSIYSYEIEVL